jgi:outer membrane cobalamin receptor
MTSRYRNALSVLLIISAVFCFASPSPASIVDLPEEEVTGSLIYDAEEDKYLSPGMVTVIRPEERAGEQRSLPDLLEEVPGLRVIRLRGRNGYAVASVRGSTSSQVAVYVDGVLMNLQSESAVDLSTIPVDNVERIEVYRGYVPSRFGAQAMGGVINVVTKRPDENKATLSLGAGSFGRYKGNVTYSSPAMGGKFFGAFGYETYDGDFLYWNDAGTPYDKKDDYRAKRHFNGFTNTDALLKWEDDHWRARASWTRRNRELPLLAPGIDKYGEPHFPGGLLDTRRLDLSLGRDQSSGDLHWGWDASWTSQRRDYDSRSTGSFSGIGHQDVQKSSYFADRFAISLHADMAAGERHFLELLGEFSDDRLRVSGDSLKYLDYIDSYEMRGWDMTFQDTIALDRNGTFLLTPSLRYHKLSGEDKLSWQVALSKEFSPNLMIKSAFGTYSRAPNMYEMYGDGAFILEPADDLRWETGKQFDIGVMWNGELGFIPDARGRFSLSGFMRESEDLIELLMVSQLFARYGNIALAEARGIEFEGSLDWRKWNFSLSATWMEGENRSPDSGSIRYNGMALPNRPKLSGTARATRSFKWGSAFAEYQYIGSNYSDMAETQLFDKRDLVNLGVKYNISPTTHVSFGVNDLFNDAEGWQLRPNGYNGPSRMLWYPIEGRSFYATLDMEF